ncbi:MAG: hypothetical protein ACT4OK_14400 [Gemmobacter sp.]
MSFVKTIDLSIDGSTVANLEVSFTENANEPDEFRITIRRSQFGEVAAEARWHVKEHDGRFSLAITSQHVVAGVCLAGCLAGIVTSVGPLRDCLKKAKDRNGVRGCIKEYGLWQAVGSLSCIYGCLNL